MTCCKPYAQPQAGGLSLLDCHFNPFKYRYLRVKTNIYMYISSPLTNPHKMLLHAVLVLHVHGHLLLRFSSDLSPFDVPLLRMLSSA